MCDCMPPDVYREDWRTARKAHHCVECRRPRIQPGDRYMDITGLWEGRWDQYRRCERCHRAAEALHPDLECPLVIGGLREELRERCRERRSARVKRQAELARAFANEVLGEDET